MRDQTKVTMYTTQWCGYCRSAKALLAAKGVVPDEVDIEEVFDDPHEDLKKLTGQLSVPQIFIGDRHIGGFDDLAALDRASELDELLGIAPTEPPA